MANIIQLRRDTAANWTRVNPILEDGEPGLEIDTNYIKYGDGNTTWANLAYSSTGSVSFDYSTVQEGSDGPNDITSITGGDNTGISLTSEEWAQLMWVPDTANVTIADIGDGPATYNWAYVNNEGFHVESQVDNLAREWVFTTNGNLTLPLGGKIGEVPAPTFVGNAIVITPAEGADENQQLMIYPTANEGNHIHLTSGNLAITDLFLGDDNQYIRTRTDRGMTIGTAGGETSGGHAWTFGADGSLTMPGSASYTINESEPGLVVFSELGFAIVANSTSNINSYSWTFGSDGDLSTPGNVQIGAIDAYGNISFVDTISANSYVYANGVSILAGIGSTYGDSNVATYLSANPPTGTYSNINVAAYLSSGSVETAQIHGNLTVGNLIVNGNTTIINTESYVVADNIIQMANVNPADTLDLGFVAHRTVGTLQHTGLVRDSSAGNWKLFSNVTAQTGSTVDFTDAIYDDLIVGNVTGTDFKFANGVSILSTVAPSSTYSNANVASYLVANPPTGTYSNTNVAAYLTGNVSTGNLQIGNAFKLNGLDNSITTTNGSVVQFGQGANFNSTTRIAVNGNILAQSGAISTSTGSGAIQVTGGVGISGNINVGSSGGNSLVASGNIVASNYNFANGVNILSTVTSGTTYSNTNVAAYLTSQNITSANIGGSQTYANTQINAINANLGAYQTFSNANAATQTTSINAINANIGGSQTYANTQINAINANLGAYQTYANTTFGASTYSNTNVAAYLTTANISTTGSITASGNITTGNVVGTSPNVSLVAGLNTWTFDNTGNLTLPGNTVNIKYSNGTPVPFLGVPNWTDGGVVQFSGTGNDPIFPTSGVSVNKVYYRQIGPKTWQVQGKYQTATTSGGDVGIDDYIIKLPNSLLWDTGLVTQGFYTTGLGTSVAWPYLAIPESNGRYYFAGTTEAGWDGGVVPYSSNSYRLVLGSNAGSTYQPWGQTFAPVTLTNLAVVWSFTFQAA
jgi:hypothetical protein